MTQPPKPPPTVHEPVEAVKPERPPAPPARPFPCPMCGVGTMGDTPANVNWLTKRTRMVLATFSLAVMGVQMDSPEVDDATFTNEAVRRFRAACESLGIVDANTRVHDDTPRPKRTPGRKRAVKKVPEPSEPVPSEDELIINHNHPRATVCGESCPAYKRSPS